MKQVNNIGIRNRQHIRHGYSRKDHGAYAVTYLIAWKQVLLSPSHPPPDPNRQCRDWPENEILRLFVSLSLIKFIDFSCVKVAEPKRAGFARPGLFVETRE